MCTTVVDRHLVYHDSFVVVGLWLDALHIALSHQHKFIKIFGVYHDDLCITYSRKLLQSRESQWVNSEQDLEVRRAVAIQEAVPRER